MNPRQRLLAGITMMFLFFGAVALIGELLVAASYG